MLNNQNETLPQLLRLSQLKLIVGLSKSSIYLMMATGDFPRPINLGPGSVAWISTDIMAWIRKKTEDRDTKFKCLTQAHGYERNQI
ncbi:MAG: helix-turn-helix transcriptional regulator [Burkholderiales bacterium]